MVMARLSRVIWQLEGISDRPGMFDTALHLTSSGDLGPIIQRADQEARRFDVREEGAVQKH